MVTTASPRCGDERGRGRPVAVRHERHRHARFDRASLTGDRGSQAKMIPARGRPTRSPSRVEQVIDDWFCAMKICVTPCWLRRAVNAHADCCSRPRRTLVDGGTPVPTGGTWGKGRAASVVIGAAPTRDHIILSVIELLTRECGIVLGRFLGLLGRRPEALARGLYRRSAADGGPCCGFALTCAVLCSMPSSLSAGRAAS